MGEGVTVRSAIPQNFPFNKGSSTYKKITDTSPQLKYLSMFYEERASLHVDIKRCEKLDPLSFTSLSIPLALWYLLFSAPDGDFQGAVGAALRNSSDWER
jgi:hypothetical protein